MANIQNTNIIKYWQGCEATGTLQNAIATWEYSLVFLPELNIGLPYNPTIVLLSIHPNEPNTYIHTKINIQMFITPFFTMPKLGRNQDAQILSVHTFLNNNQKIKII